MKEKNYLLDASCLQIIRIKTKTKSKVPQLKLKLKLVSEMQNNYN